MSAPGWHLVIVPHTHWDREWYRAHDAFRARLVRLLDDLLDMLEGDPGFRHFTLDGQTIIVDDYLAVRPHARPRIERLVRAGRLLVGPWRVLPDEWLVSGEALVRNLRRGLRDAEALGGAMPVGYVPDPFGHVGQLPQILAGFGMEGAALWRGVGAGVEHALFEWEAPDGSALPTVYLVHGYGNAAGLPAEPEALADRLRQEVASLAPKSPVPTLLLMAGMDHARPDARLPEALRGALGRLDGVTAEIGTLPGYLRRALGELRDLPVRHRGELRSGLRAPLLPGCASTRMPQKRAEFRNDARLVHALEPLSAWLGALGGRADLDWIDFVWDLALENHPHDSVCGCSVDRVHEEMDARFARVEERIDAELERVGAELATRVRAPAADAPGDGPALVVWCPHGSGAWRVEAELELERAGARGASGWHLRTSDGQRIPARVERTEAPAVLLDMELPRELVGRVVDEAPDELFGHWLHGAVLRGRHLELRVGRAPLAGLDLEAERARVHGALGSAPERVRVRVRRPERVRLSAVVPLPGCGVRALRVAAGAVPPADPVRATVEPDGCVVLENGTWRVRAAPDGRVVLAHAALGECVDDALRVVCEGDRGDSYNFDPVPGDVPVERPAAARVRLLSAGPVEATLAVEARYRVPASLTRDRSARSRRQVTLPVRLTLRLCAGLDRVDVGVSLDNTARDHRLRLHVAAPFRAERLAVESAFEIVERPIEPTREAFGAGLPAEWPVGAGPQRRFATLEGTALALTVANRGLAEVEACHEEDGRSALAITLLRAIGWLSRDDLALRPGPAGPPLPVPGAQVPGRHEAELSIRLHAPGAPDAALAAHAFAVPPTAFVSADAGPGQVADGARLLRVDDPRVCVTALEPRAGGAFTARLCNLSSEPRRVRVGCDGVPAALRCARVSLGECGDADPLERDTDGGWTLALRPWEIVTLRIERA